VLTGASPVRLAVKGLALLAIVLAAASPQAAAQDSGESLEAPIKATFLYRFADFISWPAEAFPSPATPVRICIIGEDPFGVLLDRMVEEQTAAGRPLSVHRLHRIGRDSGCHVAYLSGSGYQSVADGLAASGETPVLTVTDSAAGDEARGVIHFEVIDNRVRFHVDDMQATRHGLKVSSRLLGIAVSVRRTDT